MRARLWWLCAGLPKAAVREGEAERELRRRLRLLDEAEVWLVMGEDSSTFMLRAWLVMTLCAEVDGAGEAEAEDTGAEK